MTQAVCTVTVPRLFWQDHMERECTPAISETRKGNRVELVLSQEALDDLYSDADYYSDDQGWCPEWGPSRSVIRSAKRTLEILQAVKA